MGLRRAPERDADKLDEAKRLVREALDLAEQDVITISEINCPDPDCPTQETIILVMRAGEPTRAHKLHGGLDALSADAIRKALRRDAA